MIITDEDDADTQGCQLQSFLFGTHLQQSPMNKQYFLSSRP